MLKKRGFSLVELVTMLAVAMILILYATTGLSSRERSVCINSHLNQWRALIQKARSQTIRHSGLTYVRVGVDGDGRPVISSARERHKGGYTGGDQYALAIGFSTNATTGQTDPELTPCAQERSGILAFTNQSNNGQLEIYDGIPAPPPFVNNTFLFMPNGTVRDITNNPASGTFYFENEITDLETQYGAIYVGLNGDIKTFWSKTGSIWFEVE